jgi:glutamate-1-semialdehyde 2,1-aminomutase
MAAPIGPAYQAGTLSGNPLAVSAGIACLKELGKPGVYEYLDHLGALAEQGVRAAAEATGTQITVNRAGSAFTTFFAEAPITTWSEAADTDTARYARYFHELLKRGVYTAPSQFEAGFVSLAHTEEDLAFASEQVRESFEILSS